MADDTLNTIYPASRGMSISWNLIDGSGETELINYSEGVTETGFTFYSCSNDSKPTLIATLAINYINFNYIPSLTTPPTYPQTTNTNQLATIGYANSIPPIGTILMYAGTTVPTNYIFCKGQSLSQIGTYKNLYDVIGTNYGTGDGEDTFSLPNFHNGSYGVFPVGSEAVDTISIKVNDTSVVTSDNNSYISLSAMPQHSHSLTFNSTQYVYDFGTSNNTTTSSGGSSRVNNASKTDVPSNTNTTPTDSQTQYYPSFVTVNFIIKYN